MRIFLAGATGAVGSRLAPLLVDAGHQVTGMTRSPAKAEPLRAAGVAPVVADGLDREAVVAAVVAARPDAIVHQLTALANADLRDFDAAFALTNRLRTEGTDHLLEGARRAGARRFVAQSYAGWPYARSDGPVKTEDDPLDTHPVYAMRETVAAMRYLDETVTNAGGIVLRYGGFYGDEDGLIDAVRRRLFPIVGRGEGVSSFIHLEDAAAATVLALDLDGPQVFNVVDDEPAPVREWLPVLAKAVGAKPPRRVPRWLARLFAGDAAVMLGTESRGASNAKAKRELGWTLRHPSWREGFAAAYASTNPTEQRVAPPAARASHSRA
jgi:2-alkyl-3-oxoalkanoate reductase